MSNSIVGEGPTAVEHHDIATGKLARNFNGPFDIMTEGPNAGKTSNKRPCRAICVTSGACEIVGLDDVNVILPDMGGAWQWDIQAKSIVSGAGTVIW